MNHDFHRDVAPQQGCELSRTSCRYSSRRTVAPELLADLRQQAMERPASDTEAPELLADLMLKRKGWRVNHKLVLRLLRRMAGWCGDASANASPR